MLRTFLGCHCSQQGGSLTSRNSQVLRRYVASRLRREGADYEWFGNEMESEYTRGKDFFPRPVSERFNAVRFGNLSSRPDERGTINFWHQKTREGETNTSTLLPERTSEDNVESSTKSRKAEPKVPIALSALLSGMEKTFEWKIKVTVTSNL